MKKFFGVLAALALLVGLRPAGAYDVQRVPLSIAWDMNGEAADDDQVVTVATFADSTTFTLAAQPDTCRVVNITVVDANSSITAGVLTVTGTDCWGDALVCTWTATAGGSAVYPLVYSSGNATTCAFASITSVVSGVLTGEGGAGDTLKVGYTANSAYTYPIYGVRKTDARGKRYVDPFDSELITDTAAISSTAMTTTHTTGAFGNLAVGDLVYLTYGGRTWERRVVTHTDANTLVIDAALPVTTSGIVAVRAKHFFKLVESMDAWVPVTGDEAAYAIADVQGCSATGGCTSSVECSVFSLSAADSFTPNVQVDTDNVADAATGTATTSIDLRLAPFTHCRVGYKFGTGDTSGTEVINSVLMISKESN